jgi:hypothetical protein
MMIKINATFLILLITISVVRFNFAGNDQPLSSNNNEENLKQDDNKVDIKELVQKQIENAQLKKNSESTVPLTNKRNLETNSKTLSNFSVKETSVVNDYDLGILFAVGVGITILLLLITRLMRKKEVEIDDDLQFLKRKIEMMRNEEPFISDDRGKSELRKELCEKTIGSKKRVFKKNTRNGNINAKQRWNSLSALDDKLSGTARELKISKGELILASRIQALEYENTYRLM